MQKKERRSESCAVLLYTCIQEGKWVKYIKRQAQRYINMGRMKKHGQLLFPAERSGEGTRAGSCQDESGIGFVADELSIGDADADAGGIRV